MVITYLACCFALLIILIPDDSVLGCWLIVSLDFHVVFWLLTLLVIAGTSLRQGLCFSHRLYRKRFPILFQELALLILGVAGLNFGPVPLLDVLARCRHFVILLEDFREVALRGVRELWA